jgi:Zn-dependent protease/CBS domain-containing protein
MSWSLRVARVSGIDIRIHATFVLIVLWGAVEYGRREGLRGALFGALMVCSLFGCVVLHELGHSLVAQRFGVRVREILLLPIGGVARLLREPQKAWQELLIAVAGPAVNVAIAVGLALLVVVAFPPGSLGAFVGAWNGPKMPDISLGNLIGWLVTGNIALAVFNMIPALPMDGGRVLRSALAMVLGRPRATNIAGFVGQVLAAGLVAFGLMKSQPILAIIGAFVFLGATQERMGIEANSALRGVRAGDVCTPNAILLSPGDPLGAAIELMMRSPQHNFAVVHGPSVVGTLSREDALRALRQFGPGAYIAGVMQRELAEVDADTPLEEVRNRVMELEGKPVVVRGTTGYLGLLGLEDIGRVATIAAALRRGGVLPRGTGARSGEQLGS